MQQKFWVLNMLMILLLTSIASAEDVQAKPLRWSEAQHGLQMAVALPIQPFEASKSMPLNIEFKNVSNTAITFRRPQSPFNYQIGVYKDQAEIQARPVDNSNRGFSSDGRRDVTLAPGDTDTETIFLNGKYLLAAGHYMLKVILPVKELLPSAAVLSSPIESFDVK